jgi:hypothetical protein
VVRASKSEQPHFSNSKKKLAVFSALVLTIGFGVWWLFGGFSFGAARTVEVLVDSKPNLNATEATEELCAQPGCVEGWKTTVGNYLRFNSIGEAQYWSTILGDSGRRYEYFVLDMRDLDLTFEQRKLAIDVLFSQHDWY